MLEGKDHHASDKVFPYVASFIDRSAKHERTAPIKMYTEIGTGTCLCGKIVQNGVFKEFKRLCERDQIISCD